MLGKPEHGYIWSKPDFPSLTISYFPSNDFYFSGHIGSATLYLSEFVARGSKGFMYLGIYTTLNNFIMLTVMRAHYFIDLITGFCVARITYVLGEKLTYYYDVTLCGLPRHKRESHLFEPCAECGWCNNIADRLVYATELTF
jgi:hypothetical protein